MTDRFGILTNVNTEEHLLQAAKDFRVYFITAMFWLAGTTLIIWKKYGWESGLICVGLQVIMIWWIGRANRQILKIVAKKQGFELPPLLGEID